MDQRAAKHYRHWPSREALVIDACSQISDEQFIKMSAGNVISRQQTTANDPLSHHPDG
jgi:hypothetical protein